MELATEAAARRVDRRACRRTRAHSGSRADAASASYRPARRRGTTTCRRDVARRARPAPSRRRGGLGPVRRSAPAARGAHRRERTTDAELVVLGVFTPAGSPSAAYLEPVRSPRRVPHAASDAIVDRPHGRRARAPRRGSGARPPRRGRGAAARRGRFIDDLAPAPHAPTQPSCARSLPHARIVRRRRTPRSTLPGVIGVLTGADVPRCPARSPPDRLARGAVLRGRRPNRPLRRRAARGRRRARPLRRRGRAELVDGRLRSARRRCSTRSPRPDGRASRTAPSPTATSTRRFAARGPRRPRDASRPALDVHPGRVLRRRGRLERAAGTASPRGRTSRARSRCTASPPRRSGSGQPACASSPRPTRAARSASSRRSRRTSCCMGLASRKLGVPVRWIEDRRRAPRRQRAGDRPRDRRRGGFTSDGELLALRYDAIEDVGAYVRAPEPATLYRMHGSLSGAYRVRERRRAQPRRAHEPLPHRSQPRLRRAPALLRARADDGDRRAPARPRPGRAGRRNLVAADGCPYRTPSGGLYDSGDYEACLDDALELAGSTSGARSSPAARAAGPPRRGRPRLRGRAVDLEHGLHHARADRRRARAGAAEVGQRRGRDASPSPRSAASPCASARRRRARATARSCAQVVADALGVRPPRSTLLTEMDTATSAVDGRLGQLLLALLRRRGGRRAARRAIAAKLRRSPRPTSAATRRTSSCARAGRGRRRSSVSLRRLAGTGALEPGGPARRRGARARADGVLRRRRTSIRPTPTTASPRRRATASSSTSPRRGRPRDRRGRRARLRHRHDAGRLLNPLLADGQVRGGFAHGVGAALLEQHVYDESGNLLTASFMDYLRADRARRPARSGSGTARRRRRSRRSARRGSARATR